MQHLIKNSLKLDNRISTYFALQKNQRLRRAFSFVSALGSWVIISLIMICFLITMFDQAVRLVLLLLIFELIGLSAIIALRYATKRKRPVDLNRRIWFDVWNKYSFPSHHAYRSFMIATILGFSYPAWMPFFYIWAALIGFSRIYLRKHYLSDVIIGALLGIFIGSMVAFI